MNMRIWTAVSIALTFVIDLAIPQITHAVAGFYFIGHAGILEIIVILFWVSYWSGKEKEEE